MVDMSKMSSDDGCQGRVAAIWSVVDANVTVLMLELPEN